MRPRLVRRIRDNPNLIKALDRPGIGVPRHGEVLGEAWPRRASSGGAGEARSEPPGTGVTPRRTTCHTAGVSQPTGTLLDLTTGCPVEHVPPDSILVAEGELLDRLLVLQSGAVIVERDGTAFARIDTPGAVFGEMSVVLGKPASATVRSTADTVVRVVADPEAFLTQQPGAALAVLRMTASRLDGLTRYLVDVKQQFAHLEGHLGLVDSILDTLVHHQGPAARPGSVRDPEG